MGRINPCRPTFFPVPRGPGTHRVDRPSASTRWRPTAVWGPLVWVLFQPSQGWLGIRYACKPRNNSIRDFGGSWDLAGSSASRSEYKRNVRRSLTVGPPDCSHRRVLVGLHRGLERESRAGESIDWVAVTPSPKPGLRLRESWARAAPGRIPKVRRQ